MNCTSAVGYPTETMEFPSASGYPGIFRTPVPGLGIKLSFLGLYLPHQWNGTGGSSFTSVSSKWTGSDYTVEFYRIGTVEPGTLSGLLSRFTYPAHNHVVRDMYINGAIQFEVKRPTCTTAADSVNIPVPLGTHSTDENFQNLPWTDFSIRLNCGGGTSGGALGVHITLTDAQRPDSVSSSFRFTGSDAATGLVLNIARADGTLIYAGPESSAIGNTNQWQAGTVATGESTFTIPLKARIVPDGSFMNPGTANTSALFTLAYD
jgi:type 1 fimbria pilin